MKRQAETFRINPNVVVFIETVLHELYPNKSEFYRVAIIEKIKNDYPESWRKFTSMIDRGLEINKDG